MPDSEDGEIEPRPRDEIEDSNDTGPLLSFDFDESPMPHWSEPGSGERPEGGERPDPPEIDNSPLGGSRLFPQLPDDPHLVDTSDTGLMDAVRSDTIPTVSAGVREGDLDRGSSEVMEPNAAAQGEDPPAQDSNGNDFSQPEVPTDELFTETLFEAGDDFDKAIFDDSPIIGRIGPSEDDTPVFDTGPIEEVAEEVYESSDEPVVQVDVEEAFDQVAADETTVKEPEPKENEQLVEELPNRDSQDPSSEAVFEDEPTAELVLILGRDWYMYPSMLTLPVSLSMGNASVSSFSIALAHAK